MSADDRDTDGWSQQLEALRRSGADRLDPMRFHYLQTLSRRLEGQCEPVRQLLQDKLRVALGDYLARVPAAPARRVQMKPASAPTPLAQLSHVRQSRSQAPGDAPGPIRVRSELASVDRFRRAWSGQRALEQVRQAAARIPANAGPLNSHALVLQSLALMQELSPAYLARFLAHVESLQWLEHAAPARAAAKSAKAGKPVRRERTKG